VYAGAFDGRVYAYDVNGCGAATCQPLWAGVSGSPIDSSPAVGNGIVYVGSTNGTVSAFDAAGCGAATCQPLFQDRTGGGIDIASPTVAGDVLLVSGGDSLFAFDAAGCGAAVCDPLWKGNAELMSNTPAVSNGFVYVDAQPLLGGGRAIGTIAAFRLTGCGAPVCNPVWSGVNFATGMESSPMVANGVVYIGKGPASGFPVDSGVFMYDARGCGKPLCRAIAFVQTTDQQFYLSSTPAVVNGRLYMGSTETNSNQAGLYVWELP
jgi:outer membrane protein assembly factor BamB